MTVWFAIPTAAPIEQARACLQAWAAMGYRTAIIFEGGTERAALPANLLLSQPKYEGYPKAVNNLARAVLAHDPDCQAIVTGGDDTLPDQNKRAEEIEAEFIEHFGGTLGVMQPSAGDWPTVRGADGLTSAQRAATSPWLGREWCLRAYGGRGPLWPEYWHYFCDASLQAVAVKLRYFLRREDLVHTHNNWKRQRPRIERPAHLQHAAPKWDQDRALYESRKAVGFPGHELLPQE